LPAGDAALRAVEVSEDAQPRAVPCLDQDQEVGVGGRADGRRQTVDPRVQRLRRVAAGDVASAELQPPRLADWLGCLVAAVLVGLSGATRWSVGQLAGRG
jgi:hypothetical protein